MDMKQNWALANLKVSYVKLETIVSNHGHFPRSSHPQIHLAAISTDTGEKRYGGEIFVFESDAKPASLWRLYETGLFQAWIGVDRRTLDMLWQACTSPHDWFVVALNSPETPSGEEVAVDIEFSYKIGRGKGELDQIPFPKV
jgi:hypothetical protein